MPVTAKLSRRFYEKLGDDVANELVEWFNSVDLAYRTDLRELNELNFARFDAKVQQRFAEQDVKFEKRLSGFESRMMRWMFVYWTGTMVGTAALVLAVMRSR